MLRQFEEIDSTNEEAKRLAQLGEASSVWIVAERQTAGRGRRGRVWESPTGNLMCTLLLHPACTPAKAGELSFVAGLAIHDAAKNLVPVDCHEDIQLKWPNDLLIAGKKASGILLESASDGGREVGWLAIGIGLNLAHYPEGTPYPATSIAAETGNEPPAIGKALSALAQAFDQWLTVWQGMNGFDRVRSAWLERARGIGQEITVRLPDRTLEGVFEGLDGDGALRLKQTNGHVELIAAGDVFFGS